MLGERNADALLHRRLLAGDPAAFEALYDEHAGLVFGICRRVTSSTTAAEDLTQEVFVSFWEHPERFDPERGSLRAFLGVMAHHKAVDRVRRESRREHREQADARNTAVLDLGDGGGVEAGLLTSELAAAVQRAVGCLPADQRACVELAYFDGHTYREVATLLGIPEGTAKSRLRLALAKLADLLTAEGVDRWTA